MYLRPNGILEYRVLASMEYASCNSSLSQGFMSQVVFTLKSMCGTSMDMCPYSNEMYVYDMKMYRLKFMHGERLLEVK